MPNGVILKLGNPQGSILVPLLFLNFINDIVTDIQSTIKLFADDTSLYLIVDDPNETADFLNNDLTKIHDWATKWLVNFNAQKTETMTISRKIDKRIISHSTWTAKRFLLSQNTNILD